MEKIIELKSMELADILGIGDGHIKLIESTVPVSITARGDLLTIKGKKSDINQASAILGEMRGTLSSKGALLSDDVNNLIKLYKSGEIDLKSNLLLLLHLNHFFVPKKVLPVQLKSQHFGFGQFEALFFGLSIPKKPK